MCVNKLKCCNYICNYITQSFGNPYENEDGFKDNYIDYDASRFNTYYLYSTGLGVEYYESKLKDKIVNNILLLFKILPLQIKKYFHPLFNLIHHW